MQRLTAVRGEAVGGLGGKGEGIKQKYILHIFYILYITQGHRQQCGDCQKEKGVGRGGRGQREGKWRRKEGTSGDECMVQCADEFLLSHILEIIHLYGFANQYHPNKLNKINR